MAQSSASAGVKVAHATPAAILFQACQQIRVAFAPHLATHHSARYCTTLNHKTSAFLGTVSTRRLKDACSTCRLEYECSAFVEKPFVALTLCTCSFILTAMEQMAGRQSN